MNKTELIGAKQANRSGSMTVYVGEAIGRPFIRLSVNASARSVAGVDFRDGQLHPTRTSARRRLTQPVAFPAPLSANLTKNTHRPAPSVSTPTRHAQGGPPRKPVANSPTLMRDESGPCPTICDPRGSRENGQIVEKSGNTQRHFAKTEMWPPSHRSAANAFHVFRSFHLNRD